MTFRELALNEGMVKILVWDKANTKKGSERILPLKAAKKLGTDGTLFKVQILDSHDRVTQEYI